MSHLLHSDSLMLFESEKPSQEEIIDVIEFYASDKLAELGVDVAEIRTDNVVIKGDEVTIDFTTKWDIYTVTVVEWDRTQGVAIPLVELRRQ